MFSVLLIKKKKKPALEIYNMAEFCFSFRP